MYDIFKQQMPKTSHRKKEDRAGTETNGDQLSEKKNKLRKRGKVGNIKMGLRQGQICVLHAA